MSSNSNQANPFKSIPPQQKKPHPIFDTSGSVDLFTNPAFEGTHTESIPVRSQIEDESSDPNGLSYFETVIHLLKSALGVGILVMPCLFRLNGLILSPILAIIVTILCIHCSNVLAKTSFELGGMLKKSNLTYPETAEQIFNYGAGKKLKGLAIYVRRFVEICIVGELFSLVVIYAFFSAVTTKEVLLNLFHLNVQLRWCYTAVLLLIICCGLIRNLKHLFPLSFLAILFFMGVVLVIFYNSVHKLPAITSRKLFKGSLHNTIIFISCMYLALQNNGAILSIRNSMKHPARMHRTWTGAITVMFIILISIFIFVGFFGYLKFGEETKPDIMLNLPVNRLTLGIKILYTIALIISCQITIYGAMDAIWMNVKNVFTISNNDYVNYTTIKIILFILAVLCAALIPSSLVTLSFMGSFSYLLGFTMPVIMETVFYWDIGLGKKDWKLYKNIIIMTISLLAFGIGITQDISNNFHVRQ